MRTFFEAATGFPTFVFTVALVVVAGFWLLVAAGLAGPGSFDEDLDTESWGLGSGPAAVAVSLFTGLAWLGSLSATALLEAVAAPGPGRLAADLAVLAAAPPLAWCATRAAMGPLHRLLPDRPGPAGRTSSAA
ncbi:MULTISPECIES: hypothetical protein [unclassified Streptomyces]|uniref:hypothetical protein n=1 Tax=unclassified Streptomyces TaxID=2593676 RepID=UPI001661C32F|nr:MULTISPECIES: hypothetical protein [unclassified Streptomyces]MBD0838377.1 hypothetical protein [Streptomyces sp. TRM68416]